MNYEKKQYGDHYYIVFPSHISAITYLRENDINAISIDKKRDKVVVEISAYDYNEDKL